MLRDGATGLFLAASSYPRRLRETRNPKLFEIRPHKDALPEKYHYLLEGPDQDPDGLAGDGALCAQDQRIVLR